MAAGSNGPGRGKLDPSLAKANDSIARSSDRPPRRMVVADAPAAAPADPRVTDSRNGASLADICWRRRGTVAVGVLVCVAVAVLYCVKAPRVYTPTASLYVDSNGLQLLGKDKVPTAASDVESFLFRQCEVIRSERVVRLAVDENRADIAVMYPGSTDAVLDVRNALSVTVGKKDDVITVALGTARPAAGARVVNAVVAVYQKLEAERAHATASEAVRILSQEKAKQEAALDEKQRQIVAFKQANGDMFFTTDRGTNITVQNLATISDQATKVRLYAAELKVAHDQDPGLMRRRAWEQADAQARALEQVYEKEKLAALKINAATAEYQKLQAAADRTTKQCDLLDVRIRELDVTQQAGPDIQVLQAAKDEPKPTSPKKALALLTAVAVGLAVGCGLAVVRDATDQRLRSAAQVARLLGAPVLGVVPAGGAVHADDPFRLARATRRSPDGDVAAAFHSLAAEVCFGRPFHAGRSLLVTSPNRDDGRSTVAANLAVAAAHAGRRTLLIDADLRRPSQHRAFDAVGTLGLVDVVTDGFGLDQVIRQTDVRGLSLLPAGQSAGNPVEVTASPDFAELLRKVEEDFDLVVIDAPPLLGTGEARVLAANVDAAVLVLRAERTTRQEARMACDRVLGVGCTLLGLVINGSGTAQDGNESDAAAAGRHRADDGPAWSTARRQAVAVVTPAAVLVAADAKADQFFGGGRTDR